jgi:hypothetical protein
MRLLGFFGQAHTLIKNSWKRFRHKSIITTTMRFLLKNGSQEISGEREGLKAKAICISGTSGAQC